MCEAEKGGREGGGNVWTGEEVKFLRMIRPQDLGMTGKGERAWVSPFTVMEGSGQFVGWKACRVGGAGSGADFRLSSPRS